ncbi:hypothetical protein NIBR502772_13020 [Pseudarthrobacter sp. NIBRBAC000502772]|uniref:hypothetical protein n=1 Tax=Pseudarthrobacter sp. NIBRBAC000502772 TaxID=2590775 RepID=UPI00112FD3F2|nr:hypothetical protein [Pseudarthrobacter sp. NIBRBAC000502772]QDG66995.1 hypothetical protein NIBR502772_13020 [Pseudarthrobacter sp. NIBRBAC000502772]
MTFQPFQYDEPGVSRPAPSHRAPSRLAPARRALSAGPWSAELVGDELANISYLGRPVLRAVKAVVRDQDWRTPQPTVRTLEVTQDNERLQAGWTVRFAGHGVEYDGHLTADFSPAAVEIAFEGTALHAFRSNRIGLVVLHPPADAGRHVTVSHPDGGRTPAQFPSDISPHQPFMDVGALEWADDGGTTFRLSFTGDVFETEDQRNWTDGSFKTYSTPLARPFPVDVAAGDAVRQSVRLEAITADAGALESLESQKAGRVAASVGGVAGHVPKLAVVAAPHAGVLPPLTGLDAVLVELIEETGATPWSGWAARLQAAADEAAVHGAGLDIRAVAADPAAAAAELAPYLSQAKRLAVFHPSSHLTEPDTWPELKSALHAAGFRGELLAGVRSHFTELNRNSGRTPSDSDALTFSITPQMHSTETAHIIDSVPMQRLVAQNALRLGCGRPVHVGPVTLLPRFNAVSTSGAAPEAEADELQAEPFAAAWTLASIDALTLDGVESVAYFEASGPRGISDSGGRLNPAGELLKELAALRGSDVLSVHNEGQSSLTLYPVVTSRGLALFAGNLSASALGVEVRLPDGTAAVDGECRVFGQDRGSAMAFTADDDDGGTAAGRLTLGPWSAGVVRFPAVR